VIVGFIDTLRAEGYAVESICRVLRQQGCQIAARTYRAWKRQQPAARTMTEATVINAILDASFTPTPTASTIDAGGAVRAAQDDRVSAPHRLRGRGVHGGPVHAHPSPHRGAPREEDPHHHPGQPRR
jgi:hypothetical protein